MNAVLQFARNDHIQVATVSGLCIIALAFYFKRVAGYDDIPLLASSAPGFIFMLYELIRDKLPRGVWRRPIVWNAAMLLATGVVILADAV